jgi:plastocyanin
MSRFRSFTLSLALLTLAGGLGGCGGDDGNGGTPPSTTSLTKEDGDGQAGIVGQALPSPLVVRVTEDGAPLTGATVTWSTATAGGSLTPATSTTDETGVASSNWTLGNVAGQQSAQAGFSGATGSPAIFTAQAQTGPAASLTKQSGEGQEGEINTPLETPFSVKVADEFGNGVAGVNVDWSATGATPSATSVVSGAQGISSVNVTLGGTAGAVAITATADNLNGSPVTFSARATDPTPLSNSLIVRVGNIYFTSNRNLTSNPAVDTLAVGGTVTWHWVNEGVPHNVASTGSPSFTGSGSAQSSGSYQFTFNAAGSYSYICELHPQQMTGRVLVR